MKRYGKWAATLAFAAYGSVMLWLLFGQRLWKIGWLFGGANLGRYLEQLRWNWNLVPFKTVGEFIEVVANTTEHGYARFAFVNLAGNVVLFMPLGVFLPLLWLRLRHFGRFLLTTGLVIAAVELIQFFTLLGSADIDDLILNMVGAALGFALYKGIAQWRQREDRR